MTVKIFGALAFCCVVPAFSGAALAQTTASPIPYGGANSAAFPPFQKVTPIPPDPPTSASRTEPRLPNGYTEQQMEWLRADPHILIHPDGTIEHLHPSSQEIMQAARNNPHVPQPPAGWNSRDASDPEAVSTPSVPSAERPGPQPIKPPSN